MDIGYHGDAGGPLQGFNNDRRITGANSISGLGQQAQNIGLQVMAQSSVKDVSPVERELQHLQSNVKNLFNEIDTLSRQLAPIIVPAPEGKASGESSQLSAAVSPLHRSIQNANTGLTKLAQQVAQLRGALSI